MLLGLVGGCGGDDAGDGPLDVYAAASLAEVFPQIDSASRFSFAGSDELATQIREGAPADVYASASSKYPQELFEAGLVEEPVTFASNRLVLIVPRGNPAAIESVEDVLQRGTRLVVAAEGVPVGDYTRSVLETLGLSAALDNVVSYEDDVKGVAGKVALGEADAGFVYATDVTPVADRVLAIELPDDAQPPIEYQVAVVAESADKDAAIAFIEELRSDEGREALESAGFVVPYAKVELHDASGSEILALMTRDAFDEAGFWRGQNVWVNPRRERVFEETAV